MEFSQNVVGWLQWLTRVRFLLITFLLGIVLVLRDFTQLFVPTKYFLPLIVLWYTLAIFYVILLRWIHDARWHAPLEIVSVVLMLSGLLSISGSHVRYFITPYF